MRHPHQFLVLQIDLSPWLVSALDKLTHKVCAGWHLHFRLQQCMSAPFPLGGRTMLVQTPCSGAPSAAARSPGIVRLSWALPELPRVLKGPALPRHPVLSCWAPGTCSLLFSCSGMGGSAKIPPKGSPACLVVFPPSGWGNAVCRLNSNW